MHKNKKSQMWWFTPVTPAFGRLRQEDHCKNKTIVGHTVTFRPNET